MHILPDLGDRTFKCLSPCPLFLIASLLVQALILHLRYYDDHEGGFLGLP